jgi:SHS2 domain-containing protein
VTFRLLPHTADVKVAFDAPDAAALHQDAVDLVRTLLVGASPVAPERTVTVAVEGDDEGERFLRFVRELLYLNDVEGFLPARLGRGGSPDDVPVPNAVSGEAFDPARHTVEHGVKAVTRHQFRFDRDERGYHVEMVFDL